MVLYSILCTRYIRGEYHPEPLKHILEEQVNLLFARKKIFGFMLKFSMFE